MYSPLVKEGVIIAFHDIVYIPIEKNIGVKKLWDEIKGKYKYKEYIKDWNQKWGGIGIIYYKKRNEY